MAGSSPARPCRSTAASTWPEPEPARRSAGRRAGRSEKPLPDGASRSPQHGGLLWLGMTTRTANLDRLHGRPALVPARPVHGRLRRGAAVPARRHDLPASAVLVGAATWIAAARSGMQALRQPPAVWALGIGGLFGYHALYFAALRLAPPAEAGPDRLSLAAAHRPLLRPSCPGERLRAAHVAGALLGFVGVVVADRRARRPRRAGRVRAGLPVRLRLRLRLVGLLGPVAPLRRGADRRGRRLLPRHRRPEPRLPPSLRDDGLAADRDAVARRAGARPRPGRRGLLRVGHRREAGRHPPSRRRLLCGPGALDR